MQTGIEKGLRKKDPKRYYQLYAKLRKEQIDKSKKKWYLKNKKKRKQEKIIKLKEEIKNL
ncbi:MAG: hypothetical protein U0354_20990 [Candidatus Sericytochromatia bacterium]